MYTLFTLWPYSIVMQGVSAVYDIIALHYVQKPNIFKIVHYAKKMNLIPSKLFILWPFPAFDVKLAAILEMSTELTSMVISEIYFFHLAVIIFMLYNLRYQVKMMTY